MWVTDDDLNDDSNYRLTFERNYLSLNLYVTQNMLNNIQQLIKLIITSYDQINHKLILF